MRETAQTDEQTVLRVADFHGHMCPGLAMGIRAAEVALAEIGPHSTDEEVVAITETDMCGVDAVQYMIGCTFGNGNLIHQDYGKVAFTFLRRSDGKAVRVSLRPGGWGGDDAERQRLRERIGAGVATEQERDRFATLRQDRATQILRKPIEELYDVTQVDSVVPDPARVFRSVECASCGEPTMETRIREVAGRALCPPCAERERAT